MAANIPKNQLRYRKQLGRGFSPIYHIYLEFVKSRNFETEIRRRTYRICPAESDRKCWEENEPLPLEVGIYSIPMCGCQRISFVFCIRQNHVYWLGEEP
jgi:hypothetical protein